MMLKRISSPALDVTSYKSEDKLSGYIWMGIDQSLTGFAICVIDEDGNYVAEVMKPKTRGTQRLIDICAYLSRSVDLYRPVDVAMEGTVVHSTSASILGELAGVVKIELWPIRPLIVPPTSLKKFVTGAGNVQKSTMMMSALKRYGVEIPNDNAVDAYGLARIVRGTSITKVEEQIIQKLTDTKFRE